jgi:hypothetical protein
MYFTSIVIGPGFDMRATWLNVKQSNAALLMVDAEHYEFEARQQKTQQVLIQGIWEAVKAMTKKGIVQETRKPWSKAERYKKRFF